MKRLHIVQHVPFENSGRIKKWALKIGLDIKQTMLYGGDVLPEMKDFDFLVIMGGPMGVNDETRYRWLEKEKEFIKNAIHANKSVLGICLGAQLIAHCLDAKVKPNINKEIGWFNVNLIDSHKYFNNTLFENLITFHWHGDKFDIPKGAKHLFQSEACLNQAFIYDDRVVGLQFHPEIELENLRLLLENCGDELVINEPFIQCESDILKKYDHFYELNEKFINHLLNNLFV